MEGERLQPDEIRLGVIDACRSLRYEDGRDRPRREDGRMLDWRKAAARQTARRKSRRKECPGHTSIGRSIAPRERFCTAELCDRRRRRVGCMGRFNAPSAAVSMTRRSRSRSGEESRSSSRRPLGRIVGRSATLPPSLAHGRLLPALCATAAQALPFGRGVKAIIAPMPGSARIGRDRHCHRRAARRSGSVGRDAQR